MRIGIIGSGAMARALGGRWALLGHDVRVSGRSLQRAAEVAGAIGASSASLTEVSEHGEVVLLAVRHNGVDDVLRHLEATLRGKVVIDCTNCVELGNVMLDLPDGATSMAEYIADQTGARVVKAFNMCEASVWAKPPGWPTSEQITVLTAAADDHAGDLVAGLIDDLGFQPVCVGGLDRAPQLEAAAALVIGLLTSGEPAGSVLTWLRPTATQVAS